MFRDVKATIYFVRVPVFLKMILEIVDLTDKIFDILQLLVLFIQK